MQQFALSLYVLAITGSATIFASMLSISILPRLLLSPIAGVFGDWFDRKRTIVVLDLINSFIIGSFALIYIVRGGLSLRMIYILVILLEITEIFFDSAMSAVLPSLVDKDELLEANSFNSLVMNIGNILSPVIASLLYGTFGMKVVLIINSISFLLSAISEIFINIPKNHKAPEHINFKSFKKDLVEGINIIKGNKLISTMISLGTIINFCAVPLFSIGLIFIIKEVLKLTDYQFGIFQMIMSIAMLIAPLVMGLIKDIKIGRLCYLSFTLVSLLILVMAIIPSSPLLNSFSSSLMPFILLSVVSFIIGVLVTVANIGIGTLFNEIVPLELMGRTSTVFNFAVTIFIPLGQMLFGALYDIMPASIVIGLAGVLKLIAIMKYKRTLLQYDLEETDSIGGIIDEI
ncbi:MAG TPA: MFS transporter [Tissierellaceae bacterium]|nr:MFS transporter [Tissierellaceae bacterium]